jgi:hypothetical protein
VPVHQTAQVTKRLARKWWVWAAAGLVLAAAGFLVVSCSSSGDARAVVDRTFAKPHVYRSGRLTTDISIDGEAITGAAGPFRIALQGPFSSNGGGKVPSFALLIALKLGSNQSKLGMISNGKAVWMDLAGNDYELPPEVFASFRKAYATDPKAKPQKGSSPLDRTGFKPLDWIESPEVVGHEQVGEADTDHIRAEVNAPKMLAELGGLLGLARSAGGGLLSLSNLSDEDAKRLGASVDHAQVNVWSARTDGALRRITVDLKTKPANGVKSTTIHLDISMTDLNQPQTIPMPVRPKPFSALAGLVKTLAGTTGNGSQLTPQAKAYEACVAKAADLGAAERCKAILS